MHLASEELVMTRTKVQKVTKKGRVGKLSYQLTEPLCVVHHTGQGGYFVQQISNRYNLDQNI